MNMIATTEPSLTMKRQINASPERVFAALTRPEQMREWWGPDDDDEVTLAEVDLRVGGRFHVIFRDASGEENSVSGTYDEIIPGERVSFSWAWRSTPERVSHVTFKMSAKDGGCLVTLIHDRFFNIKARDDHEGGWKGAMDKLKAYLEA